MADKFEERGYDQYIKTKTITIRKIMPEQKCD